MNAHAKPQNDVRGGIRLSDALQVLMDHRKDNQIVVTSMGSARQWPGMCSHQLDFHYVPSTMSGAVPLALGLALAQPTREVLVCTGDGSLLMSLGCLVTVTDSGATNLTIVLIENGRYEVTGGQKTAASKHDVHFDGFAHAAAFPNVSHFWDLRDWRAHAPSVLDAEGPRFIWLEIQPEHEDYLLEPPCPMQQQLKRLTRALGTGE